MPTRSRVIWSALPAAGRQIHRRTLSDPFPRRRRRETTNRARKGFGQPHAVDATDKNARRLGPRTSLRAWTICARRDAPQGRAAARPCEGQIIAAAGGCRLGSLYTTCALRRGRLHEEWRRAAGLRRRVCRWSLRAGFLAADGAGRFNLASRRRFISTGRLEARDGAVVAALRAAQALPRHS